MSLSVGLGIARSGLAANSEQTAVLARNIANANNPDASRKSVNVVTAGGGSVRIASITRVTDGAILLKVLSSTSQSSMQAQIAAAYDKLDATVFDPEVDGSPASFIANLGDALQQYAAGPGDEVRARAAVTAAVDLASSLNAASEATQKVRMEADTAILEGVNKLNSLLAQFEKVNVEVVKGTRVGTDVTDQLDNRDSILKQISEIAGIRTITRGDNDMVIYTDGGATLFETKPRLLTFERTPLLTAGAGGNPVYIDGVPVSGGGNGSALGSGTLIGNLTVRDEIAPTYQRQLDEMARGLIEAFAESDQSAVPSLPDVPGLFTYPGAPAMPAGGVVTDGLAASITVSANVDPLQGGVPARLRDGGISDPLNPAYVYNTTGESGFSDRLSGLIDSLYVPRTFASEASATTSGTLLDFAASSVSWLQENRQTATDDAEYRNVILTRFTESLSKISGVNMDEEMTSMLELERSYQASARLISTIDQMIDALLQATV